MTEVTAAELATHQFLRGMSRHQLAVLADFASDVRYPARHRLFEDGGHASRFWLIRCGSVALDVNVPGQGLVRLETLGIGELLGWSWLFPPFRWAFGAVTADPVEVFEFDAQAVRACCAADPQLGYELTQRLARVVARRLEATRVRLISVSAKLASVS
jgi:CRP-like cAMP-binding protein